MQNLQTASLPAMPVQSLAPRPNINRSNTRRRALLEQRYHVNKTQRNNLRHRLGLNKQCPPGFILRKPFYKKISNTVKQEGFFARRRGKIVRIRPTKNRVLVKASCVKNTSRRINNSKNTFKKRLARQLKKGELLAFGYNFRLPDELRHEALVRAVDALGALQVYHKLDAVATIFANDKPEAAEVFAKDREWIEEKFQVLAP